MNHREDVEGIRMDIRAMDISISDNLQHRLRKMIVRLRRRFCDLTWVDIHFKKKSGYSTDNRTISVRLGITDNEVIAADSGDNWIALLKCVEEKLSRQLKTER
jgi:putative sigma-54 modulation protein